jgi:diaminohydroxyphosphoribosylaminopyrimidine deaminase/5-amino-6-(5-phosphoribosylamino)uracil reductase
MVNPHEAMMRLALQLAESASGQTAPNPAVGAVVAKNGRIVGLGAHLKAGTPHAEVHALRMAGEEANGAILYVTLEPCSHFGKTPPCVDAIIAAGIAKVFVAVPDPYPLVAGSGVGRLKEAGIEVEVGLLAQEAKTINRPFFTAVTKRRPFVTVKAAMTLDGKIATETGDSKWVTNERSRAFVHYLRHTHQAVMVGIGTVLADNPQLTTRGIENGRNPLRVIIDSRLRVPLDANVATDHQAATIIYTSMTCDSEKKAYLEGKGITVVVTGGPERVDLQEVLKDLADRGIQSLLVEGGGQINQSLLSAHLVDEILLFIAPKVVGGNTAPTPFGGSGIALMADAVRLHIDDVKRFDEDVCLVCRPLTDEQDKTP